MKAEETYQRSLSAARNVLIKTLERGISSRLSAVEQIRVCRQILETDRNHGGARTFFSELKMLDKVLAELEDEGGSNITHAPCSRCQRQRASNQGESHP